MDIDRKAFYSPKEFADAAGIHPSTVLEYIHSGRLYAVRISERVYRIPLASLLSALYPDEIGEPRFTVSADPRARSSDDKRRNAREGKPRRHLAHV